LLHNDSPYLIILSKKIPDFIKKYQKEIDKCSKSSIQAVVDQFKYEKCTINFESPQQYGSANLVLNLNPSKILFVDDV